MPIRRLAFVCLLPLLLPPLTRPASAWSNKEHIQLTRLAAERLIADPKTPPDMKAWLQKALPHPLDPAGEKESFLHKRIGMIPRDADGLTLWATMPDMLALAESQEKKTEPYGVHQRLLHYVDIEYFMPDEAKRTYADDLSHKPKPEDFPADMADWRYQRAGMLPFAVKHCYEKLVESIRANRLLDTPGQFPRDEHAVKWAGFLAHYAEDNTQPQHATIDYKSAAYFADKRKAPNVHSEVEYKMCDDDYDDYPALRADFWPLFEAAVRDGKDPVQTDDPWRGTIEVSLSSYDALPLIGRAAMAATKQAGTPERPEGPAGPFDTEIFFRFKGQLRGREVTVMQMKAEQTAWAVHRVQRLWLQAWNEAHDPSPATRPAATAPVAPSNNP